MTATNTKMGITIQIKAAEFAKACSHLELSVVRCSDVQAFRYCNIPHNVVIMYNCRYHGGMQ